MGITKKFLNLFKSGKADEEGEREKEFVRLRDQTVHYENFLTALSEGDLDARWSAVRSVGDLGDRSSDRLSMDLRMSTGSSGVNLLIHSARLAFRLSGH